MFSINITLMYVYMRNIFPFMDLKPTKRGRATPEPFDKSSAVRSEDVNMDIRLKAYAM